MTTGAAFICWYCGKSAGRIYGPRQAPTLECLSCERKRKRMEKRQHKLNLLLEVKI